MQTPQRALDAARVLSAGGFLLWDVFCEISKNTIITLEDNRIDKAVTGMDAGCGLRGLTPQGGTNYAYVNDINDAENAAGKICLKAGEKQGITFNLLVPGIIHNVTISPDTVDTKRKTGLLQELNSIIRSKSGLIRQATVTYMEKIQEVLIINDLGAMVKDRRVHVSVVMQAIASKNGRIETCHTVSSFHAGFESIDKSALASKADYAASLALNLLDAEKKIQGEMPVVFASDAGGTMIHEAVGHSLEADLVRKDMSQYKGRVGHKVASELVSVADDATLPNKRGSFSFDDEGTPAQNTVLIEKGILKTFMYDRESAMFDKAVSTGNGRRESYRFRPIPRMRNTMILPGKGKAADIISDTKKGIYVKKMGGGQVNTVTGEFMFEVKEGYLIENGEIKDLLRDATLMGRGDQVLNSIDAVADDLGFDVGTCGKDSQGVPVSDAQPTIRVPSLLVGSK